MFHVAHVNATGEALASLQYFKHFPVLGNDRNLMMRLTGWIFGRKKRMVKKPLSSGDRLIVSTNLNKDKSILICHHSFILQRCSTTGFDLQ
jgi:hypothetical protein